MGDGGATGQDPLTHRQKRVLFSELVSTLLLWANEQPGWEMAYDEGMVHTPRSIRTEAGVSVQKWADGVHKPSSYHYLGQAADLLLYINGEYVESGDHPAWRQIAERWESMDPAAVSGARWKDANHVALFEGLSMKQGGPLPWLARTEDA